MRIVKAQATSALVAENTSLDAQKARCRSIVVMMSRMMLDGMAGKATQAMQRRINAQALVISAHYQFYVDLQAANRKNISAVNSLPETSPGVLDTVVAQARIDECNRQIGIIETNRVRAVASAQRANQAAQAAYNRAMTSYKRQKAQYEADKRSAEVARASGAKVAVAVLRPFSLAIPTLPTLVNVAAIESSYLAQKLAQQTLRRHYEWVLDQARQYDQRSLSIYRGVSVSSLTGSTSAAPNIFSGRFWAGAGTWAGGLFGGLIAGGIKSVDLEKLKDSALELAGKFMKGDLKGEGYWGPNGSLSGEYGIASGSLSGGVGNWGWSVKPFLEGKVEGEDDGSQKHGLGFGVKAKGEVSALQGKAEGDVGSFLHGDAEGKVLTGAVEGVIGCSLVDKNGKFNPQFQAKAKVEGSVAEGEANARIGTEDYNYHGKASGQLLTASAEAELKAGDGQFAAKAGAKAYVASGELSGGITIFGMKIDVGVEGHAGGASAEAALEVGKSAAKGKLDLGLGLGAGVSISVDWSGVPKAIDNFWNGIKNLNPFK